MIYEFSRMNPLPRAQGTSAMNYNEKSRGKECISEGRGARTLESEKDGIAVFYGERNFVGTQSSKLVLYFRFCTSIPYESRNFQADNRVDR